jgi:nucleoside-diphosphate-sugar epimerase
MKRIAVLGADGYLGKYLVKELEKDKNNQVFIPQKVDLRRLDDCVGMFQNVGYSMFDEIYQLAADSGNMKYLLSKNNSYGDSTLININIIKELKETNFAGKIFFPSTFYVYDLENRYGIEKKYNEQLYLSTGFDIYIGRFFSVYGPGEKLNTDREKVTTAFCRKVVEAKERDDVVIDGSPNQTRYFLHVTDAIKGIIAQMKLGIPSTLDFAGNREINFQDMLLDILKMGRKNVSIYYTFSNTHEQKIHPAMDAGKLLSDWKPEVRFKDGIQELYRWVENELR